MKPQLLICLLMLVAPLRVFADCGSDASIEMTITRVGARTAELARLQTQQAALIRELLDERARSLNWSPNRRERVVQDFLTSPRYLALQQERAPHSERIEGFKRALLGILTFDQAQAVCRDSDGVLQALEASFDINSRQYLLAQDMFKDTK